MLKRLMVLLIIAGGIAGMALATHQQSSAAQQVYNGMFISYVSPEVVTSLANYVNKDKLGGYIVWPIQGDTNPDTDKNTSLLAALKQNAAAGQSIMAYWTNWSVYTGDHAIPVKAYPIPGSQDSSGATMQNADLSAKLPYLTSLTYAFLEVADDGTIYFNDPWADLLPNDKFCSQNKSCTYAVKPGKKFEDSAKMGNFEAFAKLPETYSNLKTEISIGGYGHDDAFENTFTNETNIKNFVESASKIMTHYNISGIDLDYENPGMTHEQSEQFLKLVQALSNGLPEGKYITVTILASPAYINGTKPGNVGFAPDVLKNMSALPNVKTINLMTYDFHGAFDYTGDNNGKTGFLSNVYMPDSKDVPAGYNPEFSIDTSVNALLKQGVNSAKINVGIPAYGRALADINEANNGLFQTLTANTVIPSGDLDPASCVQTISSPLSPNACSGSFTYSYIMNHMIDKVNFPQTNWKSDSNDGAYIGTTAYAATWSPSSSAGEDYSLEITNTASQQGGDPAQYAGIIVTVSEGSDTFTSDYLANVQAGSDKTYNLESNPSTEAILGKQDLTVKWSTYAGGPQGVCPDKFNFTKNTHIMIWAKNDQSKEFDCAISSS